MSLPLGRWILMIHSSPELLCMKQTWKFLKLYSLECRCFMNVRFFIGILLWRILRLVAPCEKFFFLPLLKSLFHTLILVSLHSKWFHKKLHSQLIKVSNTFIFHSHLEKVAQHDRNAGLICPLYWSANVLSHIFLHAILLSHSLFSLIFFLCICGEY